ncbi:hypothetical protein Psal006b_02478 [Piscirickettsia salmonis]|uniref:Uncharacterized protein n=1 Tax=Piscirickettsia salmonis TaxID=1238 RepID=A0A9Q6Q109_PISSA|nr:hypothetical protein KW89_762 [Piscirickettsia salmonis]OAJ35470.1 hypothetical protein A0O36_00254 [Piscirickettsiaceae bacterium NZ-RLO1]ALB21919.1 hypothetical protein KU39_735 [Piscirickettsia salmonis]QGN76601.1 hypothetical protein Psal001_00785 [Piscirickettsia salmonis]QGN80191.1 hypothetical protein Psal002_00810 [Piscirickettsia salmonis]
MLSLIFPNGNGKIGVLPGLLTFEWEVKLDEFKFFRF